MSVTPQQVATASIAVLNDALVPTATDQDKVSGAVPDEFASISLMRMFGGQRRISGVIAKTGYRLMVVAGSKVSVANVRKTLEDARLALEFQRLEVAGIKSTPIQFSTEVTPATKDGRSEGRQFFTFVI